MTLLKTVQEWWLEQRGFFTPEFRKVLDERFAAASTSGAVPSPR